MRRMMPRPRCWGSRPRHWSDGIKTRPRRSRPRLQPCWCLTLNKLQDVLVIQQQRNLFIGGLHLKTTDEILRNFYEKWGEIVECVVVKEPRRRKCESGRCVLVELYITVSSNFNEVMPYQARLPSLHNMLKMSTIGWTAKTRQNARVQTFAKVVDSFVDRCLWKVTIK